jgi:hypothetical protein
MVVVLALTRLWCAAAVGADRLKVEKEDGHLSPVLAEITFRDNSKRKVMVYGMGGNPAKGQGYYRHLWRATSKEGTDVRLWLDAMAVIKGINDEGAVVVLKDRTERPVNHGHQVLHFVNPDDSREYACLANVKEVRFLKPARKDGLGRAMFDDWLYSPYTGEKLAGGD